MVKLANGVDPSTLPSGTRERFALLCTVVFLGATWFGSTVILNFFTPQTTNAIVQLSDFAFQRISAALFTALALLPVSVVIYLCHPWWQSRSFGPTESLDEKSSAAARIRELAGKVGVSLPHVLIDKDILHVDAIAFGLPGHRTLLLGRGLLFLHVKRPSEFDVRLAHELTHIKNRDIDFGFAAHALVSSTKLLMFICFFAWLLPFMHNSYKLWLSWQPYVAAGHSWLEFAHSFGVSAWQFVSITSLTFFWTLPFWALLVAYEHRSFLRSREAYADISASNMVSAAALATAVQIHSGEKMPILFGAFSAHPSTKERLKITANPQAIIAPHPTYLIFFGYLCGITYVLINHYSQTLATAFPIMNVNYDQSYLEIVSAQRTKFIYSTGFTFVLLLPFVMAFGSLGARACLNQLISASSLIANLKAFAFQGALFATFFVVGVAINPLISLKLKFNFGLNNSWTLSNSWTDFVPGSFELIIACAMLVAYVLMNLVFVFGLWRVVHGPSKIRPGPFWRFSIIGLWIYGFVEATQLVMYTWEAIFNAPLIITSRRQQELIVFLILAAPIMICGISVWIISYFVGRRGAMSKNWSPSEFSRWMLFPAGHLTDE